MSSIWNPQDRFILSNMTSEKLYAKSPLTTGVSGTSAYIGLEPSATYNETVLYSGAQAINTQVTLSESMNNFDKIEIYTKKNDVQAMPYIHTLPTPFTICVLSVPAGASNCWMQVATYNCTETTITPAGGKNFNFGGFNSTATGITATTGVGDCLYIYKVVGINRKEV